MSKNTSEAKAGFSSPDAALRMPRAFGRLLLLKLLARGGMGDVYLAATTGIEGAERPCVVKTVRRDHIHDGSFLARFLDEARVQSQLNHPGVAQILEASTDENGEPYTVVEYVEGRSLSDVRQRAIQLGVRIGWVEAVAIAIEMATALAHVHERAGADGSPLGIVHRDLSPQNVMVGYAGEVKLIDFGTARGHNRKCHTVAGVVFAKPGYVAPEVARQQVGDGRIDIYALGIMLWELCAGRRFLTGDAQQHLEDAAAGKIDVPAIAKEIDAPPELDICIAKMTENDPDVRYLNASMAASDLAKVLAAAPAPKIGERGVRARTQTLMRALWPHEPQRVRSEFARLLKEARALERERLTPPAPKAAESAASLMNQEEEKDPSILAGTPYRILRTIGEGASGVVYEAEHLELGRRVALKVLAPEHASAKDSIDRFRREARSIAKLSHPNLCLLYDFGKSLDGRVFLAMELLSGETLEKKLKRSGGMDWREALRISIEAARALEAAHGAGLVHRDLKPANLFLTKVPLASGESRRSGDGTSLKLLDFGVAMALSDVEGEKRQKGFAIFGTPEYMAPEQVAGEAVDGRCDIYALGCVLYELITGSRPFSGGSSVVVMGKQLRETPESPRLRAPHRAIPADVDAIVMKALAKKPDDRFASAEDMRTALEAALLRPAAQRTKTRRMTAGVALLSIFIGVGAAFAHGSHGITPDDARQALHVEAAPIVPAQAFALNDALAEKKVTTHDLSGISLDLAAPNDPIAPPKVTTIATRSKKDLPKDPSKDVAKDLQKDQTTTKDAQKDPPVAIAPLTKDKQKLLDARTEAETHPEDAHALQAWANAAFKAGDYREARRATEAWSLRDGSPEPRIFLAEVLDATGKRADARAVLEEVLDLHPDSTEARRLHAHYGVPLPSLDSGSRKSIAHR